MNPVSILLQRAEDVPDWRALVYEDGREWTNGELVALIRRQAEALASASASRVGIYLDTGPQLLVGLYATWALKTTAVPFSSMYGAAEMRAAIAKTAPDVFVTDELHRPVLLAAGVPADRIMLAGGLAASRDDIVAARRWAQLADVTVEADQPSVLFFTGGTTGPPKVAEITYGGSQQSLEQLAGASLRGGRVRSAQRDVPPNLVALPLFHTGGQSLVRFAYYVGRSVILMEKFRVELFLQLVHRYQVDNLFLLPTMLHDVLASATPEQLESVTSVLVSGGALSAAARKTFEDRFQIPILSNYGSTEVGNVAGWTKADVLQGRWKPGSVGRVYDGLPVQIRDDQNHEVAAGVTGEICVLTSVARRYVGDDAVLREADGWVHTQDIGWLDEDNVLFLVGRTRDMIKCGGFQVWPAEIEEVLLRHELVREVAVVGQPDERLGEVPVAYVVPSRELSDPDATGAELIALCRASLAHFKAVRHVVFVPELPRTSIGKLAKTELG